MWPKRPTVSSSGLIAAIANRRHRKNETRRPLFKSVAFNLNGAAARGLPMPEPAPAGSPWVKLGGLTRVHPRRRAHTCSLPMAPGDVVATVDERGHIVIFRLLKNEYEHVKHVGTAGALVKFSNRRRAELFVALADHTVHVYNVETRQLYAVLKGHRQPVHSITFNAAGTLVCTASVDCAIIWSASNWERKRTLGCGAGIFQAAIVPGAELLLCGFKDDTILAWDAVTYDLVARLSLPEGESGAALQCFSVTADGRFVLAGSRSGSMFLWEVRSQTLVRIIDMPLPTSQVSQVEFLPNGRVAAALGDDGRVVFASVAAGTCRTLLEVESPRRALLCFATDPAGRYLASVVSDGRLLLHDVEAARRQRAAVRAAQRRMGIPREELDKLLDTRSAFNGGGRPAAIPSKAPHVEAGAAAGGEEAALTEGDRWRGDHAHPGDIPVAYLDDAAVGVHGGAASGATEDKESPFDAGDDAEVDEWPFPRRRARAGASAASGGQPTGDPEAVTSALIDELFPMGRPLAASYSNLSMLTPTAAVVAGGAATRYSERDAAVRGVAGARAPPPPGVRASTRAAAGGKSGRVERSEVGTGAFTASGKLPTRKKPFVPHTRGSGAPAMGLSPGDAMLPLYRIAELQPHEVALNVHRLRSLLQNYGEFPDKYRLLIWRFLLRLPENHEAFRNLVARGVHPSCEDLHERYPIKDQRLFRKLRRCLSAIAFWSPVFGELPYLPALAFPFVKLFQRDDLAAFETVLTVLLNWGSSWVETFPHAPLQLMGQAELLLQHHDPELADHLRRCGVDAQRFAWPMISTAFTEVLAKDEWLVLWDNLVSHADDPSLLLMAVVAYLRTFRTTLLAIPAAIPSGTEHSRRAHDGERGRRSRVPRPGGGGGPQAGQLDAKAVAAFPRSDADLDAELGAAAHSSREQVVAFLRHQSTLDIRRFVATMLELKAATPSSMLPSAPWPGSTTLPEPHDGGVRAGTRGEVGPAYALPVGEYPAFLHYPKFVVDFQLQERERIRLEERELERKRHVMDELAERSAALEAEENAWRIGRTQLLAAEEARRAQMAAEEEKRTRERRKLDASARERRLEQVAKLQETARAALAARRSILAAEAERSADEAARQSALEAETIRNRLEEEALLNLEFQAMQRVEELKAQREAEVEADTLRAEAQSRRRAAELDDRLLGEAWKTEDEERKLMRRVEAEKRERERKIAAEARARRSLESQHLLSTLEREVSLAGVARERRLRHVAEDQIAEAEGSIDERKRQEEIVMREESLAMRRLLLEEAELRRQDAERRMGILLKEKRQQALETEARQKRLAELERSQNKREFEEEILAKRAAELEAIKGEERELQNALLAIEEERRRDRELELRLLMKEQEVREKSAFQRAVRESDAAVVDRERRRFETVRQDLRSEAQSSETAWLRAHEEAMAARMVEREKELWRRGQDVRDRVYLEETSRLASEYSRGGKGGNDGAAAGGTAAGAAVDRKQAPGRGGAGAGDGAAGKPPVWRSNSGGQADEAGAAAAEQAPDTAGGAEKGGAGAGAAQPSQEKQSGAAAETKGGEDAAAASTAPATPPAPPPPRAGLAEGDSEVSLGSSTVSPGRFGSSRSSDVTPYGDDSALSRDIGGTALDELSSTASEAD